MALIVLACGNSLGLWQHLIDTVLVKYIVNTVVLMGGVGLLSLAFGVSSAWIISRYSFPFRWALDWLLILPATIPAYLIAYTYTDLLEFAGPVQGFIRSLFGWNTSRDYWFPEIRSMGGAIFVMSAVLYPYIYLLARTAFSLTPASLHEAAKVHNNRSVLRLDLALGRPAIIAGLALVLMEVVSDFGTVEYFAVETLTLGIFNVWLGMNSLTAAAQIAILAFVFIFGLLFIEIRARKHQQFFNTTQRTSASGLTFVSGWRGKVCIVICFTPVFLGFILPITVLLNFAIAEYNMQSMNELIECSFNSFMVACFASIAVIITSLIMVLVVTQRNRPFLRLLTSISALGYAFPGVVLAIGVVSFFGAIDQLTDTIFSQYLSLGGVNFVIGSMGLLVFAYVVRFQAIGYGAITTGIDRMSPNILNASMVLGVGFTTSLGILAPRLLKKSIILGGLLVFVDVMKELPMTLLLRPFNFETLSTHVYQFAKDELLEKASVAALVIVLVSLVPLLILNASHRR